MYAVVEQGRETAGTTMCLTVRYVRDKAGDAGVQRVLALAGEQRTVAELEDECRWSTYEQKIALWEAAARVLDDPVVSRHIGESALQHSVGASLRVLLRTLGSPRLVLSNIAKTSPKFSTVATMEAVEVRRSNAIVTYELHEPKQPHLLDCQCNIGLLSVIGPLFGMPPLTVEHPECQVDGAPRCRYEIRWPARRRLFRTRRARTAYLEEQLAAMTAHLESLESTAADLVADDDVDAVLGRIVARAGVAVRAPRYLLAVRASEGEPVSVHADGYANDAQAHRAAGRLLGAADDGEFEDAIVIDVASSRRTYGRLAAFGDGHSFFDEDRRLLAAYARSAAAALDAATALDSARRRGATAQALLELAHALAEVTSASDVAQKLAEAMPAVVDARAGLVFLWDPEERALATRGRYGWPAHVHDRLGSVVLRPAENLAVAEFVTNPGPALLRTEEVAESLRPIAESLEAEALACVPIMHQNELLGLAVAGFPDGTAFTATEQVYILDRLGGVAHQAATALRNASLLARVRRQALHDTLTGLANRALFEELVNAALARSDRDAVGPALLFVDLDRFKRINDSLGHEHGDRLLCEVSARLSRALRAGDALARLGGDEFGVLLHEVDRTAAVHLAERVRSVLEEPVMLDDQPVVMSASIGIAVFPQDGITYDDLLRHADIAMYDAKERGRNTCREYEADTSTVGRSRIALETDLRRALLDDQLVVLFQPEVELATDRVVGLEALVRWDHPVLSRLGPDRFLHAAEEAGLSLALDAWVLRNACRQAQQWRSRRPDLRVAVNVAAANCARPELVDAVSVALRESGLDPAGLELEISETTALNASADALGVLASIRDMGVSLALDDFGTGYSLFGRLRGFSVERVKIDGSFVRASSEADSIVPAVTTMCHGLGIDVAAVGVETPEQLARVRRHGCDIVQGFLLGAPVDPAEVPALLDAQPLSALGDSAPCR